MEMNVPELVSEEEIAQLLAEALHPDGIHVDHRVLPIVHRHCHVAQGISGYDRDRGLGVRIFSRIHAARVCEREQSCKSQPDELHFCHLLAAA